MSKIFEKFYGVINDKEYKDIHQFMDDLQVMQDDKNNYEKKMSSFSEFVDFLRENFNDGTKELINECNEQNDCNVVCEEDEVEQATCIYGYSIPSYQHMLLFNNKDGDEVDNVLDYQNCLKNNFDAMCDNIDDWSLDTLIKFKEDLKESEKEFAYYQVFMDLAKNFIKHASEITEDTIVSKSYEKETVENKTTESNMMDSIKYKCGNFLTQEEMDFLKKNLK